MQENQGQTKMVAADASKAKLIKVKCLRDFKVKDQNGEDKYYIPGQIAFLTEEQAKEICDKEFKSYFNYRGERFDADGEAGHGIIVRGVRI